MSAQAEDLDNLKAKVQALSAASMKIGETLSQQSGGGGGGGAAGGGGELAAAPVCQRALAILPVHSLSGAARACSTGAAPLLCKQVNFLRAFPRRCILQHELAFMRLSLSSLNYFK